MGGTIVWKFWLICNWTTFFEIWSNKIVTTSVINGGGKHMWKQPGGYGPLKFWKPPYFLTLPPHFFSWVCTGGRLALAHIWNSFGPSQSWFDSTLLNHIAWPTIYNQFTHTWIYPKFIKGRLGNNEESVGIEDSSMDLGFKCLKIGISVLGKPAFLSCTLPTYLIGEDNPNLILSFARILIDFLLSKIMLPNIQTRPKDMKQSTMLCHCTMDHLQRFWFVASQ